MTSLDLGALRHDSRRSYRHRARLHARARLDGRRAALALGGVGEAPGAFDERALAKVGDRSSSRVARPYTVLLHAGAQPRAWITRRRRAEVTAWWRGLGLLGPARRALDRDGRRLAVEHAMAIAAIAPLDLTRQIAAAMVQPLGFRLVDDAPIDDKEARIRLESALRSLGPIGEAKLFEAYGGRR